MATNNRIDTFDLLKGIGIILVLLGHTSIHGLPRTCIYNCHMALFFMVSGCFFKERRFKEDICKGFKQLIIPYFIFLIIWNISLVLHNSINYVNFDLSTYLSSLNILDENCLPLYAAIWFLPCLFFVRILASALHLIVKGDFGFLLSGFILYCLGYFLQIRNIDIPFFFDAAISSTFFYILGYLLFKNLYPKLTECKYPSTAFIIISLIIYVAVCYFFKPQVDIKANSFPFYHPLLSLFAILPLFFLCRKFEKNNNPIVLFVKQCGKSSLTIMGLHRAIFIFIWGPVYLAMFKLLGNIPGKSLINGFVITLLTLLLLCPLDMMIKKFRERDKIH